MEAPQQTKKINPEQLVFGNLDKVRTKAFPYKLFEDCYCVELIQMVKGPSGGMLPDPGTARYQFFDDKDWHKLNKNEILNGKEMPSYFQKQNLKVTLLHDPHAAEPVNPLN